MDNDDKPIGQLLSRRDALKLLGIGSAAFLAACATPEGTSTLVPTSASTLASATQAPSGTSTALDCVVRPEMTIGPYFVDEQLNRSDIRSEPSDNSVREGLPLTLAIGVFDVANNSCTPITDAQVDVWHCDAQGVYSGVSDQSFDTTGQKFLRGYQLTDGTGKVQFLTIYPGWYSGRTVHIHFTIRTKATDGSDYQFTSQFFFDDALTDQVHAQEPYASKGQRNMHNADDNIYNNGGDQLLLNLQGDNTNGYTSAINIGLDLTDLEVGAADSMGGPGGGPPP
ncbi:MAG TPA: intradiol ring-cleavage dioxygenase [Anaerolineales bacterium]|nr:intradiol ring-cleavage dioxygenase [Anaerolineales bacterium]